MTYLFLGNQVSYRECYSNILEYYRFVIIFVSKLMAALTSAAPKGTHTFCCLLTTDQMRHQSPYECSSDTKSTSETFRLYTTNN